MLKLLKNVVVLISMCVWICIELVGSCLSCVMIVLGVEVVVFIVVLLVMMLLKVFMWGVFWIFFWWVG